MCVCGLLRFHANCLSVRRHKGLVSVPTTGGRDGAQFAVSFVHLPGSTCCREHRLLSSFSSCRYFLKEKSVSTKTSRLHPPEFTDVPWAPPGPRSPRSLDSTPKPQGSERHLIVWISPNHNTGVLHCSPSHLCPTHCSRDPVAPSYGKTCTPVSTDQHQRQTPTLLPGLADSGSSQNPFLLLLWLKSPRGPSGDVCHRHLKAVLGVLGLH